ncbi:neuronal acetylcholine receptor subunit beta-3-like [Haliotis rubra]|uniref:neuronal acetylcholine receptor subunit beta-3-like n=1 Tax=Haliotis rubra TaxID=36100 RepID=UPI001EE5C7D5|nr:neuronal acetylcholine receptor subunit beta-3-like [Haliotis rubra]
MCDRWRVIATKETMFETMDTALRIICETATDGEQRPIFGRNSVASPHFQAKNMWEDLEGQMCRCVISCLRFAGGYSLILIFLPRKSQRCSVGERSGERNGQAGAASPEDIIQLKKKIFDGYDRYVRPVHSHEEAIQMDMVFSLGSIDSLDLKSQKLKWNGWLTLTWHDKLLSWNASQYGDTDFIMVPQTKIWLPDYVINNDVSAKTVLGNAGTLVFIRSSGKVTWEPGMISETSCKIDIRKYPFDTQTCSIDFLPWMTTSKFMNTTVSSNKIEMSGFVPHGEFTIAGSSVVYARFPAGFTDDDLVGITFSVVLNRRPAFYWMIMIFPMMTFPLLCPISFLVPVESGEKITLSITVVLSYLVFIGSMNDAMPKLSDTVSLMVIYASLQTTISILTVVANGIIICIHKLPSDFQVKFPKFPKMSQRLGTIGERNKYLVKGESLQSVTGSSLGLCHDDLKNKWNSSICRRKECVIETR